jgi:3-oxoadipate enol-lactonase
VSLQYFFVHGSGCTGDVFAAQLAAFPDGYATTLPGHAKPGAPATIGDFADAVAAELAANNYDEAIVCGSSMGGAIALELAVRAGPRVKAIVLLGSGSRLRVAPALFESLEGDFPAGARALAPLFFADPTPERIEATVAMMLRVGQAQTVRDFRACDAFDLTDRLGDVRIPILALTGESDRLTPPKYAQLVADRVPGGLARILPGAGHLAMVEKPEETNAALREFAGRLA